MRFSRYERVTVRLVKKQRSAASKKWIRKKIDKAGLFADEVKAEMPTPEERIERHDEQFRGWLQSRRDVLARKWRELRRKLWERPEEERQRILSAWSVSPLPGDPGYFENFLKAWDDNHAERMRPVDDMERHYLDRLKEWTPALNLEPRERLFVHAMQQRGLVDKRVNNDLIEFRALVTTAGHCEE